MKSITPIPANVSHLFFTWSYFQSRLPQSGGREGVERMKARMKCHFLIKIMSTMY